MIRYLAASAVLATAVTITAVQWGGPDYRAECRTDAMTAALARIADASYVGTPSPSCAKLSPGTRAVITAEVVYAVLPFALSSQAV